ncbi:hypothetical protein R9C00_07980 [Flammeovirgaceae bacterium SG7u.111]|nr:hypothetical protein [Flammeovirgaceae bacterium SG7u.132]WPO37385.1 hypothetical protein R9C00_07980 [Flammeovirgaceae bacterium SG7u.111]
MPENQTVESSLKAEEDGFFVLPTGVSGFFESGGELPQILFEDFEKACLQIAAASHFDLKETYAFEDEPTRNYYLAFLTSEQGNVLVFCNKYFQLIAVSELMEKISSLKEFLAKGKMPQNQFADVPEVFQSLPKGYDYLTPTYLAKSVNADNEEDALAVNALSDIEFAEFSYWEPRQLSDIVFNNWG